jgi:hypothetical protein
MLALLLVANSGAVFASDFQEIKSQFDQTTQKVPCHPAEQRDGASEPTKHDGTDCEMTCCEDSKCSERGICIIQYNSDVVAQKALKFSHPIAQCGWGAFIAAVPDRELLPENPPPILI